jgi:hypothetical protein
MLDRGDAQTGPDPSSNAQGALATPCTGELSEVGASCPASFDGTAEHLPACDYGEQQVTGCDDLVEFSWGGGSGSAECIYSVSSHALVGARQNGDYPGYCNDGGGSFGSGSLTWTAGRTPKGPCTSSFMFNRTCKAPDGGSGDAAPATDCAKLQEDWAEFVRTNSSCQVDADCSFVGGPDDFNQCATASIGSAGKDAIATSAIGPAYSMFLNEFYGSSCAAYRLTHKTVDQGPSKNLRCQDGVCTADLQFCNAEPPRSDAGVD